MGVQVFRFKSIKESEAFKWQRIMRQRLPYLKYDRYEFARLNIKFTPGIYRFKNFEAKREREFQEVCKKWKKQK